MVTEHIDVDMKSLPPSPAPGSPMQTRSRPSTPRLVPVAPVKVVHRQRPRVPKRNRDVESLSQHVSETESLSDGDVSLGRPMIKRKRIVAIEQNTMVELPSTIVVVNTVPKVVEANGPDPAVAAPEGKRPRSGSNSSMNSAIIGLVFTAEPPSSPSKSATSSRVPITTPPPSTSISSRLFHIPSPLASAPIVTPGEGEVMPRATSAPASTSETAIDITPVSTLLPGVADGDLVTQLAKTKNKLIASEVEHLGVEMNKVFSLGYGRGMARGVGGSRRPSRLRDGVADSMKRSASDGMDTDMDLTLD